jgi:predicted nucleotidyltransferase
MTLPLVVQQEIVQRLRPLAPAKVILFGSYAKGTATEDSDIDLVVVIPGQTAKTHRERMDRAYTVDKVLWPVNRRYAMDTITYSSEEAAAMELYSNAFWKEVKKTGKVLYAV